MAACGGALGRVEADLLPGVGSRAGARASGSACTLGCPGILQILAGFVRVASTRLAFAGRLTIGCRPMAAPFDPALYVRAPIFTMSVGITLAFALVDACPKSAPANVKKACKHLKTVAEKAQSDLAERNRRLGAYSDEDSRTLDNEADRAWGALRMRLQAMGMLNPEVFPKAPRAAQLETSLFAEGTEFLKAEFASQSTSMASLLQRIDADKLAQDIDELAGKEFLQAVRNVQPRYEAMVKERLRRDNASGQNFAETVRAIQAAIVNYAAKIIGTIEHDDPATTEVARIALLPIHNHREASARAPGVAGVPVQDAPNTGKPPEQGASNTDKPG
jgi:hypothetical protein